MERVGFENVSITGGLWRERQRTVREVTAMAVYNRFKDTGRIDAFRCDWQEGMPFKPHVFWDSDVAKWIEGVAYLTGKKREPKLEALADEIIANIAAHQWEEGYFNIHFTVVEPENRFTNQDAHELYCAGHLMEAAVAYYEATGKRVLLDAMCRYADYIDRRFRVERNVPFAVPGHEEIELALVRLYRCTGEKKYLELAAFFVNERGVTTLDAVSETARRYHQSHLPAREQFTAEGHAVRAVYFYCGMADIARETGDEALKNACEKIFGDIAEKKMYVTGGIGSSSCGEAFTVPYDLPNLLAYSESCAALGLALFCGRMLLLSPNAKYADVIERVIYNGFLSSLSLDGKSFFYENPLEVIPYLRTRDRCHTKEAIHWPQASRSEVFNCSCCPPNILRFIASIGDFLYTEDGGALYVHQFMQSESDVTLGGKSLHISQKTRYPESGVVRIRVTGGDVRLYVRVPGWCERDMGRTERGYLTFDVHDGEEIRLDFGMKVRLIEARPEAVFDCGRVAVMRGPVVYCTEGADNKEPLRDICINPRARFVCGRHETLHVPTLTVRAVRRRWDETGLYRVRRADYEPCRAVLIPYYAFANRGECGMQVWHHVH